MAATVEAGTIVLNARFVIARAMITYPPTQQSTTNKRERGMCTTNNAISAANMTLLLIIRNTYRQLSRSEARRHIRKSQGHPVEWDYGRVGWTSSMTFLLILIFLGIGIGWGGAMEARG